MEDETWRSINGKLKFMLQGRYFPGMFGPMGLFPQPWLDPAFLYNEYLAPRAGLGAGPGPEASPGPRFTISILRAASSDALGWPLQWEAAAACCARCIWLVYK